VTVGNCAGLSIGDRVLVIQMKGATIDLSNTSNSGLVTSYNNAGNYDIAVIDSMNGCELIFHDSLKNKYTSSGVVQVVTIPQYTNVTVVDTLKCLKWDGTIGGVLIFEASGTVTLNAPISVSGRGFLGGVLFSCGATFLGTFPNYAVASVILRYKGEGIATLPDTLLGGRGTVANGGGAGGYQTPGSGATDAWYNGGGGGGNYGKGGDGGLSSTFNTTQYPGGLGGRALTYSNVFKKIYMGGGGGSGHRRYTTGGPTNGTDGAGIVIIKANTIVGNSQSILADGIDNQSILSNVGRGGGGAGGTVLLDVQNYTGTLNISAKGGKGGDNSGGNKVGPGGGGGGGIIWLSNAAIPGNITSNVSGGLNGQWISTPSLAWGATAGANGTVLTNLSIPQGVNQFIFIGDVTSVTSNSPVCQGGTINLIGGTIPGNTSYLYSGPNGYTANIQSPSISNAAPINSGTYHLQVLINGCPGPPVSTNVTVYPTPARPTVLDAAICYGSPTPTLTDTANQSGTINWYNAYPLTTSLHIGKNYTPLPNAVGTYNYYITQTQNNCPSTADTAILTIYPIPATPTATNKTVCQGNPVPNLTATGTGTIKWYNNAPLTNLVFTGSSFNTGQGAAGIYTYYVTQTINNCQSPATTVTLTIYPIPTVTTIPNIAVCPLSQITIPAFVSNPTGATFSWTNSNTNIGLVGLGSGNISSWTAPANSTGSNITGTITVTPLLNGCSGTPMSFTVTIYPKPTINQKSNITVCPGSQINFGNFVSSPIGASDNWVNSNINIGLGASGSGNIPAWTAPPNLAGSNVVGTITVTPTLNGCVGSTMSFTITIYPSPIVNQITNIAVCPGSQISIPSFVSSPTGATFTWTNTNTNIGLTAAGSGNIASWTAPANNSGVNITSTICVTPTLNGCLGAQMCFTVTVYPTPGLNQLPNILVCPSNQINLGSFVSVPSGATFTWTNSNTLIGIAAIGSGDIPQWTAPVNNTGSNIVGTICVTPTLNGCLGTPMCFTITIYPSPSVNTLSNIAVCPGSQINIPNFISSPSGATFSWTNSNTSIGLAVTGGGNIPQWLAPSNNTGSNIVGTICVTPTLNGCSGTPMCFTVTIYPTPFVNTLTNIAVCPGSQICVPAFTSNPVGATFTWTNSNTSIGLVASGSGNIACWAAPPNITGSNITGIITVTPTLNGCQLTTMSFNISVYPTPSVSPITNIAVCPGTQISIGNFASIPTGASFSWTNSNTAIGLLATNGVGNIPSWNAPPNATNANITGTITVIPTLNLCTGNPMNFTVSIYPTPSVNPVTNITVCPGSPISIGNFGSVPSGATFTWTNSNTNIGLIAVGTGNIATWTAPVNNTGSDITGTICVTPTLNGCPGTQMCFTVTIHPTPTVNAISNIAVCPGSSISIPAFVSVPSGATFTWANSNTAIGLVASSAGNIATWTAPANNTGANITGTICVIPTLNSCAGPQMCFTVTIYPTPTVVQKLNIAVCPGSTINIGPFVSVPTGATFAWTNTNTNIGLIAIGSGNIATWTAPANNTGSNITATICVTPTLNGCQGTPMCFTVTIYPTPTVTTIPNIAVCPGSAINIPNFVSVPSGASFTWANSNTAIGLVATGAGNITTWTSPANNTGANITGTICVTPTLNGCQGTPMCFTVTIYPSPTVNAITNIAVCPGTSISIPIFGSTPTGATYAWTNSNTNIGLVASGTGNIAIWTAPTNNTGANITGTICVTPTLNGCQGTPICFTVTIYPTPTVTQINNISVCPNSPINVGIFGSVPSGATFTWTNSNTAIGLVAGGAGNIATWNSPNTNVTITGTITVTPTLNGCTGTPMSFTVTISPSPTVNPITNIAVCPGAQISISSFVSVPSGATFTWTNSNLNIGLVAVGSGDIVSWTAPTNTSGSDYVGTICVTPTLNGCPGTPMCFTVTVFTAPTVNQISNISVCSGATINTVIFVSNPTGSIFPWSNSNTLIGLPATGAGNIAQWTAPQNNTTSNITGTITVTPSSTFSCVGIPMSFTVTIYPVPTVTQVNDITVCPGSTINIGNFVPNITGATFAWNNTNAGIGISTSGSGNITSWTAPANNTGSNITGIFTVTPSLNGCTGTPMTFSVTISPKPTVTLVNNIAVCPGSTISIGNFVSNPTGASYTWTNTNANIGIATTGIGNIASWTAPVNNTGAPFVGTIAVIPTLNGCAGNPMSFTVTIYPTPSVVLKPNIAVCPGSPIAIGNFVSAPTGATFAWTSSNTNIGLVAGGTGNIATWTAPMNNTAANIVDTIKVTPSLNGCSGSPMIFTVIVYPTPTVTAISNIAVCPGAPITIGPFGSNPTGATFAWANSNINIGLVAGGTGNITTWNAPLNNTGVNIVGTITVTPTLNGCAGTPMSFSVTIYPTPAITQKTNISVCPGSPINIGTFVSAPTGASIVWNNSNTAIGLAASGTGNITTWTAPANPTNANITGTITVTPTLNGCSGPNMTFTITIYPTPTVTQISNIAVCAGSTINVGNFVSAPSGATFAWANSNTAIGLASSGAGSIASWIAPANSTGVNITGTITVIPALNGCAGTPMIFTVTIYPTPVAPTVTNGDVCFGLPVPDLTAAGVDTILWYNNPGGVHPAIDTLSTHAVGYTAVGTYNYWVTQIKNNCESPVVPISMTIHPIPQSPFAADTTICFGDATPNLTATGSGTIKWYPDNTLTLPVNTGATFIPPVSNVGVYKYYITQTVFNCESLPDSVLLTINPVPLPPTASDSSTCFGQAVPDLFANGTGIIQWYTDASLTPPPVSVGATFTTGLLAAGTTTFYVTQKVNGCESSYTAVTLTIFALPQPPQTSNVSDCYGQPTPNLTATAAGTINWYNDINLTSLVFTGSSFPTGDTAVGTYTYYVTQTHLTTGCQSTHATVTLTINPIPALSSVANIIACPGTPVNIGNFVSNPGGATFNWANSNTFIGLAAIGTGTIPQWNAPANSSGADIVGTITVTPSLNGCPGLPVSFTVTIKPTPSVNQLTNIGVCPGTQITIPNFGSTPTGGTFSWTNSNTAIGIPANSTGNITSWTAPANNTGANIVGTLSVTTTLNGCTGSAMTFTVTIYPTPSVTTVTNITTCPGSTISIPAFVSAPAGGAFAWSNSNTVIGLAANGTGNISSWTAPVNTTNSNITGTVTVTPTLNGCTGTTTSFTVTIKPTPSTNAITNIAVCPGTAITIPAFSSTPTGSTFAWANTNTVIGLVAGGSGNITTWNAPANTSGANIVGTLSVTPTLNSCVGTPATFTVTINPTPVAPVSNNVGVCFGTTTPDLTATATGTIKWYTSGTLGTPVFTGSPFATGNNLVGTYTYYVTQTDNVTACQSLADTVSLIIHPIPSAPVATDVTSCQGSPTPNLTATGAGTINWYNNGALIQPSLFTGSSYASGQIAVGSYTYYVTQTVNNCESPSDTVTLNIYPIPAAPIVSVNTPVCEGSAINFTADTVLNGTYSWTGPSSYISSNQNPVINSSTVSNGGQYGLSVSVNGCPSPVSNINVVIIPALTPSISGNTPFCQGHTTVLDAGVFYSYHWSTNDSTETITISTAGVYSVTVSDINGCSAADTVIATFTTPPPAYAGLDTGLCLNNTVQLSATGGVTYDWSPSAGLSNSGISTPVASPTVTTTYTLTVLDANGCSGTDNIVVTVHPLPNVNFVTNVETGCAPLKIQFSDLSTPNIASWAWQFGDPLSGVNNSSIIQNPTHIFVEKGSYSVTLSVVTIYGCTGQISYPNLISVFEVPIADFDYYPLQANIDNPVINFNSHSTNDNAWIWNFGDNSTQSIIPNPTHEFINPGTYNVSLIVQSTQGCTDTIIKEVTFKPFYTFYAPNAFTPNGDGLNDVFIPKGVGFNNEKFNLYIYNRWGELVFETADYNLGWDGNTSSGNPAPQGVYTWIVLLKTFDGTDLLYRHTGQVSLLTH